MWGVVSSAKVRLPGTCVPHPHMATEVELLPLSEQNGILMLLKPLHVCLTVETLFRRSYRASECSSVG